MNMKLSDRIRHARSRLGLSQAELAARLRVHRSAVGHWERGAASTPSCTRLLALAEALEVGVEWLARGTGPVALAAPGHEGGHQPIHSDFTRCEREDRLLQGYRILKPSMQEALLATLDGMVGIQHGDPHRSLSGPRPV